VSRVENRLRSTPDQKGNGPQSASRRKNGRKPARKKSRIAFANGFERLSRVIAMNHVANARAGHVELTFGLVECLHRVFINLITILGAVAGSHGLLLFE
jgi:hypothetical protein